MYVIEALHPEGWRRQGRAQVEYWAYQEAQARCCSDGRNYRILNEDSGQIVALVNTTCCQVGRPIPPRAPLAGQDTAAGRPSRDAEQAGR